MENDPCQKQETVKNTRIQGQPPMVHVGDVIKQLAVEKMLSPEVLEGQERLLWARVKMIAKREADAEKLEDGFRQEEAA